MDYLAYERAVAEVMDAERFGTHGRALFGAVLTVVLTSPANHEVWTIAMGKLAEAVSAARADMEA